MNNGYCQITIGEKPVGIKFAYLAIKLFTEASEKKIDVYFNTYIDKAEKEQSMLTIFGIAKLIQSGYINNCELKEVEPEIPYEEFYNWVEQQNEIPEGQIELARVLKVYSDSTYSKKLVNAIDNFEKKSQETNQ